MVVLTIEVPPGVYPGHLIGAKGQNIRMIQNFYGVKIDYQPNKKRQEVSGAILVGMGHNWDAGTPDRCTFTGPADQVEKAKEAFQFLIDLVRADKSTTDGMFPQWFQERGAHLFRSMIHEDEEKRKKHRENIMEALDRYPF